jgi:hypothetical protein
MAEYKVTYTSDGKVKHELNYKKEEFSYTMIPDEHGKTGDKKSFAFQVADKFPNEDEEIIEVVDELTYSNEDEIEEILELLTRYEQEN